MSSGPPAASTPSLSIHYDQWHFGVLLSILASFVGGLGDNFVRYAHTWEPDDTSDAYEHSRLKIMGVWLMGLFLTVVGNTLLTIWSLAFADASLIVPFAASHVIFTVVLAIFINGEHLNYHGWWSIVLILVGLSLIHI